MERNSPKSRSANGKSRERLPSAHLLVVECQTEKLNQLGLGLGSQVLTIAKKNFPKRTSSSSGLLQHPIWCNHLVACRTGTSNSASFSWLATATPSVSI